MEEILKELLVEIREMRQEMAYSQERRFGRSGRERLAAEPEAIGERGPELLKAGEEEAVQQREEENIDYGGDLFWKSNAENSREQEDLLGRFLVVAQNIKCCSIDCAFHKMRFGCALKGVYLTRGKCSQFLPREEWLKISGKMGVR